MNRDRALMLLRRLRPSLEGRGIAHAALFGSVARDEATSRSDIDVVVVPARGVRLDLFDLGGVQSVLDEAFGIDVDIVVEPIRQQALRRAVERDRADAF